MTVSARTLRFFLLAVLMTAPWLSGAGVGPSPAVWPWLVSAASAAFLVGIRGLRGLEVDQWLKAMLAAWLAAAVANGLIGLSQYFGWAGQFDFMSTAEPGEAYGNLRQRNQLATLTSIGLLALIAWRGMATFASATLSRWQIGLSTLLAAACAATSSRTGLLQWLVIVMLVAWWPSPQRRAQLIFAARSAFIYGAGLMLLPWLLQAITGAQAMGLFQRVAESAGCSSRLVLWSNVIRLIAEKPWLGWGWGNLDYAHYVTLYEGPRFCDILDNAHNLPLHLAVELGIPVALLLSGSAAWFLWRARPWQETDPIRQCAWGVLAVIFIHSMLEYPLWYGPFQIAVVVCLLTLTSSRAALAARLARPSPALAGLAAVALPLVIYAAWDYHRVSQIYRPPEQRSSIYRDDTLAKVQGSWLYRDQVRFAELTLAPLSRANAEWTFATARVLLHYSPEPRIIEKVIESATLLGRDDEALTHLARYRSGFPAEYARWSAPHHTKP